MQRPSHLVTEIMNAHADKNGLGGELISNKSNAIEIHH